MSAALQAAENARTLLNRRMRDSECGREGEEDGEGEAYGRVRSAAEA